jgi:molybdopterin-guanine dinucleotide biosynthesis protein A
MIEDCTALILAGGQSRRMGRDKTMLPFGQATVIQTLIDTLRPLFSNTILSVRVQRPELDLPQICDATANKGPLGGLVSGLAEIHTNWAFVIACDMPMVHPGLIRLLSVQRAQQHAIVARVQGHIQPFAAFYSTRCLPLLRARLDAGQLSISSALQQLSMTCVDEADLIRADPGLNSFFDLDTPEDWRNAQNRITGK